MDDRSATKAQPCRLCHGVTEFKFTREILGQLDCGYYECLKCRSLQTESPFWIERAYRSSLSDLDTGAANRCLRNQVYVYYVSRILGARTVLDYGGGDGLLTRLLRDLGVNCYVYDVYADPLYTPSFQGAPENAYDLVCAFEVVEHMDAPREQLEELFSAGDNVLLTTGLYAGQDASWWYLSPHSGQHVFFYSWMAMREIARCYGFEPPLMVGEYILFTRRRLNVARKAALAALKWPPARVALRAAVAMGPKPGVAADFNALALRVDGQRD